MAYPTRRYSPITRIFLASAANAEEFCFILRAENYQGVTWESNGVHMEPTEENEIRALAWDHGFNILSSDHYGLSPITPVALRIPNWRSILFGSGEEAYRFARAARLGTQEVFCSGAWVHILPTPWFTEKDILNLQSKTGLYWVAEHDWREA